MLRLSNELNNQQHFGCLKSSHFTYQLAKYKNTIGRHQSCNIIINHPSISKEHALIEYNPQKNIVLINDLASSNGTYVNDTKLTSSAYLHQNDKLRFGKDDTEYNVDLYYQLPNMSINDNNNISFSDSMIPKQNDKRISLVNDNNYTYAQVNHLGNRNSSNPIREELYMQPQPQSQYKYNNNNNDNEEKNDRNNTNPLFDEISKQRGHLSELVKQKGIELEDANRKLSEMKEQYNQLQFRYNELRVFSNELKKRNETLELELKFNNKKLASIKNPDSHMTLINEKNQIISILQNELKFLKEKSPLYQLPNEDKSLSKKIDELIAYFTKEGSINQKKKEELMKENEMLNETIKSMIKEKTNSSIEYQNIINSYDKRLLESMNKYSKSFEGFDAKKEEAAKFLIEQVEEYLKEKERIVNENIAMKNEVMNVKGENQQLKNELNQYQQVSIPDNNSNSNRNNTADDAYLNSYSAIRNQIDQKTKEINELKSKLRLQPNQICNKNNTVEEEKLFQEISMALKKINK